jgi:hypothetical protein
MIKSQNCPIPTVQTRRVTILRNGVHALGRASVIYLASTYLDMVCCSCSLWRIANEEPTSAVHVLQMDLKNTHSLLRSPWRWYLDLDLESPGAKQSFGFAQA